MDVISKNKLGRHLHDVTRSEGAGNMQSFFMIYFYGHIESNLSNKMYQRMIREYPNNLPREFKLLWMWNNWM